MVQIIELDIYIGKLLNNRYLIRDLIGKGNMSRVYLAEDTAKGGLPVVVKILSLKIVNQQMSQHFAKEIFIGAQLGRKSKHIIRVLSYGVTKEKTPFYVMEYLEGKNLKDFLKEQLLTISQFLVLCRQICLGLQCAHQGVRLKGEIYPIVHWDIKPENIFVSENSKKEAIVKILDFGIAKFITERSGMTVNAPDCFPEHSEQSEVLDVRSDIYSLGVVMFEMLTGKHPFQTTTSASCRRYQAHCFQTKYDLEEIISEVEIPQELKKLVMDCLAKEINKRPQTINQVLKILDMVQMNLNIDINNVELSKIPYLFATEIKPLIFKN
jgi:serine/threonine protein kinase